MYRKIGQERICGVGPRGHTLLGPELWGLLGLRAPHVGLLG